MREQGRVLPSSWLAWRGGWLPIEGFWLASEAGCGRGTGGGLW